MITKTYIPGKPRNKKLTNVTSGAASVGKTEFNQVAGSSHEHPNKGILDRITEDTLNATLRDILTSIDDSIEPSDDNLMSSLRVLAEILKNNEDLKEVFLSKVEPDTAQGLITFLSGLNSKEIATLEKGSNVGNYSPGLFGSGGTFRMNNGVSELEVDKLFVRMRAEFFSVLIHQAKHIGGELIISAADMICNKVEEFSSFYRCYFDRGENNEVNNLFTNQDRARCQVFTGSGQKFYWRKVIAVGPDYIELSKTDASPGTNDIPEVGDRIFQLGSDDPERQSAIIISSVGADAPSWKQYAGINGYSLVDKETTVFTSKGNRIQGKTVFTSGGSNLDDYLDATAQDIQDAQAAANAAALKAQQALDDAAANVGLINTEVAKLQAQIDGEVSNWFYPYSPTLSNYPASEWTTNEIKDRHIGDTFTNTAQAPATDAGKSWRFVKNGSVYSWTQIADSDAVLALQKAAQAQSTADGKSTTFLVQPSNYKLGDMWVLNADRTVNGTAYKQGEILTATQDSTTFVEAHWLKRVRYTDQDAIDKTVNELEIGGRNLIIKANLNKDRYVLQSTGELATWAGLYATDFISVVSGEQYIISATKGSGHAFQNLRLAYYDSNKVFVSGELHTDKSTPILLTIPAGAAFIRMSNGGGSGYTPLTEEFKFEKGNKVTGYSPAPEDVQAEINNAKQEALTAASDAQSTADSLKNFTDTAFRDGIIDRSESVAIEKYKNSLNEAMSKAEASYNKVYTNTYLEGAAKTSLLNAKVNLWGQRDTLLSAINTAISGGATTPAQKTAVDNAFSTFNNLMTAFQNALEEANKAIQVKLDNISKGYVDELEIGGRNLLIRSTLIKDRYLDHLTGNLATFAGLYTTDFIEVAGGADYTFFAKKNAANNPYQSFRLAYYDINKTFLSGLIFSQADEIYRIKTPINAAFIRFSNGGGSGYTRLIDGEFKVEKGTKATGWAPAPEDVQAEIDAAQDTADDAAAEAADALAKANTSKAITDKFKTTINGGLINTVITEFREADSEQVTGLISGIQGADKDLPFLVAGGTYAEGIAGTAKAIIRHDGTVKFTDGEFTGTINATSGEIGGFTIGSGRIGVVQSGDNPTNNGMALYNEFIKFSNGQSAVFLGTNVLPSTTGTTALARLESTYSDNIKKYGLIINVSGANSYFGGNNNVAISLEKGVIDRLRWQIKAKDASSGSHLFSDETEVVLYLSSSNYYVSLPAQPEVGEIKIVTRVNAFNVQVRGNGNEIMETDSAASTSIFFGPSYTIKAKSLIFRWDGNYWIMNQWA